MTKTGILALGVFLSVWANSSQAAQLNYGRYFGTLRMDGQSEVLAVSLDAFVTQLDSPTNYPRLDVILRVNLGGYFSSEYVGYEFYNPTYEFEKGILELNDPANDLSATLQIKNTDSETVLEGPVLDRRSGESGTLRVAMNLDDLSFNAATSTTTTSFIPVLKGNYLGTCGGNPADLQIETGRGLEPNAPGNALIGYSITGRLGFSRLPGIDPAATSLSLAENAENGAARFRSLFPYSAGTYSPYTNRLTLQGPRGILSCTRSQNALQCLSRAYDETQSCVLSKASEPATPAEQLPAGFFLNVPAEDKQPLPAPLPPGNGALVSALNGRFYGFLHYENRDVYQLLEMDNVATTSTVNPHILNQVFVEPTFLLRLGSSWDSNPALSLLFAQRVFYLNPGFAFQTDGEDYFAVIGEWRTGYVSGVMYSRSYGRVGTFELVKGSKPSIPAGMTMILDPSGSYEGPNAAVSPIRNLWSLSLEVPDEASQPGETGVALTGEYGCAGNRGILDAASLDLNTGALQFLIQDDLGNRIVSGQSVAEGGLRLLWPAGPNFGAPMDQYEVLPFTSVLEGR